MTLGMSIFIDAQRYDSGIQGVFPIYIYDIFL